MKGYLNNELFVLGLAGHEDRAWSVAWNPVRPLLASCSGDKTVRLYHYRRSATSSEDSTHMDDGTSGEGEGESGAGAVEFAAQASVPTGHAKTVRCVAWAPSGKTFATASFDANIAVWEQEAGGGEWECASLLEGHETECKGVAYSSTGTLLASCSRDKTVWVWEVQPDSDFECMGVLMTHTQDVKCVAWHPREEILASGSYDDTIKLYVDDPEDDWYDFQTLRGHASTVWALAFAPGAGGLLASASDDGTVRVWRRAETWRWEPAAVLEGCHARSVYSVSWGKRPGDKGENGGWLASAGGDGRINVWDIRVDGERVQTELIARMEDAHGVSDVNCVTWCPREGFGDVLASAGDDCAVRVWRIER
ncbi:WD40 repeat-like protein [Phellopilus nigrolimitatus]|nr:WD40 repeat-like protein [Phellopilus nigrolimitatus]